jgi:hypothetical protein
MKAIRERDGRPSFWERPSRALPDRETRREASLVGQGRLALSTRALRTSGRSFVQALVALKAGQQSRWIVEIGDVAGRARHTGRAAAAGMLAVPGAIIMSLANPIGVKTTDASHDARYFPQTSSASRVTAGAFGFFILSQSGECPDR